MDTNVLLAEKGLKKSLENSSNPDLATMLGAVIAVKHRGGWSNHIFEIASVKKGVELALEHGIMK